MLIPYTSSPSDDNKQIPSRLQKCTSNLTLFDSIYYIQILAALTLIPMKLVLAKIILRYYNTSISIYT